MMIDLRSDTVTRPSKGMLAAMSIAEVGDDVFGEDQTVNSLEEKAARMFGKEAAVFCPSGTMTNQIAIRVHTQPGDEVICDVTSHIYKLEGGGMASNSGVSPRLITGNRGLLTASDVLENINPDNFHYPITRLVAIENTSNRGGGSFYSKHQISALAETVQTNRLKFHLDGARIFNALVETGDRPEVIGRYFDSISICLSKGLGAPMGSLLIADKAFIAKARRVRKVLGGGMRQAGYAAAAGIYAFDHHINRLREDHKRAKEIGEVLKNIPYIDMILPIDTNIIIFKLNERMESTRFVKRLKEGNILANDIGKNTIRFVTHLDFTDEMLDRTLNFLKKI